MRASILGGRVRELNERREDGVSQELRIGLELGPRLEERSSKRSGAGLDPDVVDERVDAAVLEKWISPEMLPGIEVRARVPAFKGTGGYEML
jgi:hypothetical protein